MLFLIVTLALFYPVLNFEYLGYDDQLYIVKDSAIRHLSLTNLKSIFLEPYFTAWYPLTRLSHAIEYVIFGNAAFGTHLVNLLLHFLNATILFLVLLRVGRLTYPGGQHTIPIRYAAAFASVLFIVHPQHVEVVAWAVQRKELLATLFALLSINLYLRHQLFATGVFITLAMLSKASTVMLPLFFVLMGIALIEPKDRGIMQLARAVWASRWLLLLALSFAALTFMHHQAGGALFYEEQFPLLTRLILYADNSLRGLYHFFTLQPELFHLPISEYVIDVSWLGIAFLTLTIILLIACAAFILTGGTRMRIGAMGMLFYFSALLPVAGLVVFGNYAFGDRYMYFSSIGIFILVFVCLCVLFSKFSGSGARRWVSLGLSVVVFAAFMQSQQVLPKWTSDETIWLYDLERRPDSVFANHQLGQYYFLNGESELAYPYFKTAIESDSNRFRVGSRTASALFMAEIMCGKGEEEKAIGILAKIPDFEGDMRDIEMLIGSLQYSGNHSCAKAISDWYKSLHP